MRPRHLITTAVLALAGAALTGCGSTHPGAKTVSAPTSARLLIAGYAFHPKTLTVKAGARLTVTNNDQTAHTATATAGAFDSGTVKAGQTIHFTVNQPGVYHYYCQFHAFMTGTIKVVP